MNFPDALMQFKRALQEKYGPHTELVSIGLSHETFDQILIDMHQNKEGIMSFNPSSMNDLSIYGVKINAENAR